MRLDGRVGGDDVPAFAPQAAPQGGQDPNLVIDDQARSCTEASGSRLSGIYSAQDSGGCKSDSSLKRQPDLERGAVDRPRC